MAIGMTVDYYTELSEVKDQVSIPLGVHTSQEFFDGIGLFKFCEFW